MEDDPERTDVTEPKEFIRAVDPDELLTMTQSPSEGSAETGLINRINELPKDYQDLIKEGQRVIDIERSGYKPPAEMPAAEAVVSELTHGHTSAADASLGSSESDAQSLEGKFAALYGRDSIEIAKLLSSIFKDLPRTTVLELAKYQSAEDRPMADQKIGQIPHEVRFPGDKIAERLTAERGWEFPYYGSVDATPNYITMLTQTIMSGQLSLSDTVTLYDPDPDASKVEITLSQSLESALQWLDGNQDEGQFGLIEYRRQNPRGIENQILRDSPDSMSDRTGRIANHERPIASIQAQADAYDAYMSARNMFLDEAERTGDKSLVERADEYERRAQHLHDQVIEKFWIEDERGGFFAVGLDYDDEGDWRPLDTRTNDMAFLLNSGLLDSKTDRDKIESVIATLESEEMKVGTGGLRSLSNQEVNFLPTAYHNGSDWLVADAEYGLGLEKHGYTREAIQTYKWIIEACESTKAFPEYVMGGNSPEPEINDLKVVISTSTTSNDEELNTLMQPPEMGQGWSVAAYILAKERLSELEGIADSTEELEEDELVA